MINAYIHENKPEEGFVFAQYSMLWITALGAVTFALYREACQFLQPIIMHFVPTMDSKKDLISDEESLQIAKKIETHIFDGTWYTVSAVWGYMLMKD